MSWVLPVVLIGDARPLPAVLSCTERKVQPSKKVWSHGNTLRRYATGSILRRIFHLVCFLISVTTSNSAVTKHVYMLHF